MYLKLRLTGFSFSAMKVYYLHVVRDALHANTLRLSEPRIDARARAYTSVSVCTCVISTCARDKELTRSLTRAFMDSQNILLLEIFTSR